MGFATMDRGRSFVCNGKGVGVDGGGLQHQQQSEESESTALTPPPTNNKGGLQNLYGFEAMDLLLMPTRQLLLLLQIFATTSHSAPGTVNLGSLQLCFTWELRSDASSQKVHGSLLELQTLSGADISLGGPVGQVYSLAVADKGKGMLFAGAQDGTILAWGFNDTTKCFDPSALLKGHNLGVVTLVVGSNMLYSGSMDSTVKLWDLNTMQCVQTLTEHTSAVMSLLCWDRFLLDGTVRVWAATDHQTLKVVYTHTEEHGVLRLCVMLDATSKPVLLCSSNNNVVYVYDLPSFEQRGKIFSKEEVRVIQAGPEGDIHHGGWHRRPESVEVVRNNSCLMNLFSAVVCIQESIEGNRM